MDGRACTPACAAHGWSGRLTWRRAEGQPGQPLHKRGDKVQRHVPVVTSMMQQSVVSVCMCNCMLLHAWAIACMGVCDACECMHARGWMCMHARGWMCMHVCVCGKALPTRHAGGAVQGAMLPPGTAEKVEGIGTGCPLARVVEAARDTHMEVRNLSVRRKNLARYRA